MEVWKSINGYEGLYEVSNTGLVRSLYREFIGKDGKLKKYASTVLKVDTSSTGSVVYARVTLSKDGKTNRIQVHRLVAETFIPNPDNKPYVNHVDNVGLNNNVSNLEWVTHSENMIHAQKQGRLSAAQKKGAAAIGGKLKADTLQTIKDAIGTTFGMYTLIELVEYIPKHTKCKYKCSACDVEVIREFKYVSRHLPNHKCKIKI